MNGDHKINRLESRKAAFDTALKNLSTEEFVDAYTVQHLREAYEGTIKDYGDIHAETSQACFILGLALSHLGHAHQKEALSHIKSAYQSRITLFGKDSPTVAITKRVLASFLLKDDTLVDDGISMLRECIQEALSKLGDSHVTVSNLKNDLGHALHSKALYACHCSLNQEHVNRDSGVEASIPSHNITHSCKHRELLEEALSCYEESAKILTMVNGILHTDTLKVYQCCLDLCVRCGYTEREKEIRRLLSTAEGSISCDIDTKSSSSSYQLKAPKQFLM